MPYIPKRYGESKIEKCPFCQSSAFLTNEQGIPVCKNHKDSEMGEVKCVCGETLDMRMSKYGVFFTCMTCGPMSMRKVLEINTIKDVSVKSKVIIKKFQEKIQQSAQTIRSDDPRYFD